MSRREIFRKFERNNEHYPTAIKIVDKLRKDLIIKLDKSPELIDYLKYIMEILGNEDEDYCYSDPSPFYINDAYQAYIEILRCCNVDTTDAEKYYCEMYVSTHNFNLTEDENVILKTLKNNFNSP